MTMTCEQVQKALHRVENLIAGFEKISVSQEDEEHLGTLRSLRHHRAWLRGLLAVRRIEKSNKVVSLDLWRSGFDMRSECDRRAG